MARVLISMPEEFLSRIDEVANGENRTRSELIREALRVYIKRNKISNNLKAEENATLLSELLDQFRLILFYKKTDFCYGSQYKYFLFIILGGDLGIVDTWHATINFKIMVHATKKVLQKLIFSYKTYSLAGEVYIFSILQ